MPPSTSIYSEPMEDGPTFAGSQNSTVASSRRYNSSRIPPVLPVSPIKKVIEHTENGRSFNTSIPATFRRRFNRTNSFEEHTKSIDLNNQESSIFDFLSKPAEHENRDLSPEIEIEKMPAFDVYQQVMNMQKMLADRGRKEKKITKNTSVLPTPRSSFILRDSPCRLMDDLEFTLPADRAPSSTFEVARGCSAPSMKSTPVATQNQPIFEELVNLSLDGINRLQANAPHKSSIPSSRNPVEIPSTVPIRSVAGRSPVRQFSKPDLITEESDSISPRRHPFVRNDVSELLRDLHCDVDSLPRKGCSSAGLRQNNSSAMKQALGGGRSLSQPRNGRLGSASTAPARKVTFKESPTKMAPFCSTASMGNISQAIHANEQQLLKLVSVQFPHWRTFVRNLLTDSSVGNDVAVRFLAEMENRRSVREFNLRMQRIPSDDERSFEFDRIDELILTKLRDQLTRFHPSRIQQLRILYQVLRETCG